MLLRSLLHFLLFSFFSFLSVYGTAQDCSNPDPVNGDYLYANNIRAFYMPSGSNYQDLTDERFWIYDPLISSSQPVSTIFSHGLWMGGYDSDSNLALALSRYNLANGSYDYFAGPLMDDGSITNPDCTNFDKVWKVYRYQIEAHQADFADNGIIDNPIAAVIGWPAQGNEQFEAINGFALPDNSQRYAAFADLNGNDIYEPLQGEYPNISQTTLVDQAVEQISWMIFNTRGNIANGSGALPPLAIEVQLTAWAFNCTDNDLLNYTTFASYKIINKGIEGIQGFRAALWTDFNLGCSNDDYVGSAPMLNTYFAYNQDNDDNDEACTGSSLGIGENPPVQSISLLNQSLDNFTYYSSALSGTSPNTPPFPYSVLSYYNLMDGLFADGTPITRGGNGYNPISSSDPVSHAFPENPNDESGWSEYSAQTTGINRRTIGSTGLNELPPGGTFILDVAYAYHREEGADHLANVNNMYANVAEIQNYYDSGFTNICSLPVSCEDDCIWAGDLNADGIANHEDLLALGFGLNESGPTREGLHNWYPRAGESWLGDQIFGVDKKHLDADGNGVCEEEDFVKTEDHYNFTRAGYAPVVEFTPGDDLTFVGILLDEDLTHLTPGHSFLGRIKLTTDIPGLQALAFIVEYDPYFIHAFAPYSLGTGGNLYAIRSYQQEGGGRYDYAEFAIPTGTGTLSGNIIDVIKVQLRPQFLEPLPTDETFICFRNIQAYLSDGTKIELGASKVRLQIDGITVDTQEPDWEAAISIFPNPVTDQLQVNSNGIRIDQLQVFDSSGRAVSERLNNTNDLDIGTLPAGLYYLRIYREGQFVVRKFVKMY